MRNREADRLRLVRHDVRVLVAGRRAVDGEEAESVAVAGHAAARDDQGLRVGFVFNLYVCGLDLGLAGIYGGYGMCAYLADPGRVVCVEEFEGLEVTGVDEVTLNGKGEVSLSGLALKDDGGGGGGRGEEGQGGGSQSGDEHHFRAWRMLRVRFT